METQENITPSEEELLIIKNYRPIDDDFMRRLFRNNKALAQEIIRIVTNIDSLKITKEITQYDMNRLLGSRSICLDVFCEDDQNRQFNIEIQRIGKGMPPERPRYHLSAMDVDFLKAGMDFTELPTTYSIIFAEEDIVGAGQLIYVFDRMDANTGIPLNDRTHIIIVNCSYNNPEDNSPAANLARDFLLKNPDDMSTKILADTVRYFKTTEEGVCDMCRTIEELLKKKEEEVERRTYEKAAKNKSIEIALRLLAKGKLPEEEIAECTKLTIDEIQSLASSMN